MLHIYNTDVSGSKMVQNKWDTFSEKLNKLQ